MKTNNMKVSTLRGYILPMAVAGLAAASLTNGLAGVGIYFAVPPPPTIVISPPAVTVTVGVPDTYVWDGTEYVGMIGDQYYYLGPGNAWIVCDPVHLDRFHGYMRVHPDWRAHATANVHYRNDAHGHYQPYHGGPDHRSDHKGP